MHVNDKNMLISSAKTTSNQLELPDLAHEDIAFSVIYVPTAEPYLILKPILPNFEQRGETILEWREIRVPLTTDAQGLTELSIAGTKFSLESNLCSVLPLGFFTAENNTLQELIIETATGTFSEQFMLTVPSPVVLQISPDVDITASVPIQRLYWDIEKTQTSGIIDCSAAENTNLKKTLTKASVIYESGPRSAGCDFIAMPELPRNQDFLLRVTGRHISGSALKVVA